MEDRGAPRLPPAQTWQGCDTSCPPGEHSHLFRSYEPLTAVESENVDAEDLIPPLRTHEADVWLTGWQIEEDGLDVLLDEEVRWELVLMDQDWLTRMFEDRRPVSLQRDTSAGLPGERYDAAEWTRLSGRVIRIDQVSVRYPSDRGAGLADVGSAMQHTVSSLRERRGHHGSLVGWILRIRDNAS